MPYRIDLAGGWLDQPFVGKYSNGSVLTISIEPTIEFNERSGMASSTRRQAIQLWHTDVPSGDKEKLADYSSVSKILREIKSLRVPRMLLGLFYRHLINLNITASIGRKNIVTV